MKNCKICGCPTHKAFSHKVLNKYNVTYYKCSNCEYLFTEEPFWLEQAYDKSVSIADTGIMQRNVELSRKLSLLIALLNTGGTNSVIDYGGGYGILCRLLRDKGIDCYWHDNYSTNIVARGFEANLNNKFSSAISIEVFEHLVDPVTDISNMFGLANNLIASTELLPQEIPEPIWWYYSFETGQHIGFYSKKTMETLAGIFQKHYYFLWDMHIFLERTLTVKEVFLIKILGKSDLLGQLFWKVMKRQLHITSRTIPDHQKILGQLKQEIIED